MFNLQSYKCPDCRRPVEEIFRVCESCMNRREARHADELNQEKTAKLALAWVHLCPPLYRDTDLNHCGLSSAVCHQARVWWAKPDGTGLGFYGPTGVGKTRAMWEILRRHHFAGRRVLGVTAQSIQAAVSDYNAGDYGERNAARKLIRECKKAGILFIDDLGKEKATEAVAGKIHEIIEARVSHKLPILWTSEMTGEDLGRVLKLVSEG